MNKYKNTNNKGAQIKKRILVISIIILLSTILTGCATDLDSAETTRDQLEELDPTSYSDIEDVTTSETPEYAAGDIEDLITSETPESAYDKSRFDDVAYDTDEDLIELDFLGDESRITQTVFLGEPVVLDGLQFTFEDNITGGRIDNYWSLRDGQAYINVPVEVENVSDEVVDFFRFGIREYDPAGIELDRIVTTSVNSIRLMGALRPGEIYTGYVSFIYDGDGDYTLVIYSWSIRVPYEIAVLVPIYDVQIPDIVDRYNRDVPIPAVIFDLPNITLFNHNLPRNSFFYSVPYESDSGNIHMILRPNDIVRDPEGVITHDSLRIGYVIRYMFRKRALVGYGFQDREFDAVAIMENAAETLQQGGNPFIIIGDIRATEDRMTAFMHTRRGAWGGLDLHTRLFVIQMLPDANEYVIFETWLWTTTEATLEGERRTAIEEFGELTGIDFIGILRDTFEG